VVAQASAIIVKLTLGGQKVPEQHVVSFTVDRDIGQPDMASLVVYNQDHRYSKLSITGDVDVTVKSGDDENSLYKGEIVGLEPMYKGGEPLRYRKSLTFTDKTDQQIISQVIGDAGLSLDWKHDKSITYKHVYQHNQSAMEFVRTRAARMGCHLWCVDSTLHCKQPELDKESGVELKITQSKASGEQLRSFSPRISSAPINKKVTVKGWNPETKELITGDFETSSSPLGSEHAVAASKGHGSEETFTVDHPIWSKEEADALAKAKFMDQALTFITGEAEAVGMPKLDIATTVKITANADEGSDTFNGKYYVMGLSHRYVAGGHDKDGGFVSILRLARDAQKGS
jgi:phage protein D